MAKFINDNKWQLLVLTISVFFLYAFGVNGPLFWDDMDWIVKNPLVHSLSWSNISAIFTQNILSGNNGISNYYRPLLLISFIPNYLIAGTNPFLYHVVNDLIHLTNGLLIYYLIQRWLNNKRVAFITAFLFLVHPLQTEAVSYVVGRGDPMSVLFILVGIVFYINKRPWLTAVAMILAILTRETGVLFSVYLFVALFAFERGGLFWNRFKYTFIKVLPYIGISAIYGIFRLTILNFQNTLNFSTHQDFYTEHVIYRIYTFFDALTVYLRLILWPVGLHMDRDIPASSSFLEGFVWFGGLLIITCICWLLWLYRKKDKLSFNIWFFGLGIFFANLSLSSGIIAPINARILEHWLYFSLFGAFIIIAWYLDKIWSYLETRSPKFKILFVISLTVYGLFLGYQTIERNLIWSSDVVMYKNIIQYEPQEYRALNNLGNWYYAKRDRANAIEMWQQAIDSNPNDPTAYTNMGVAANDEGRVEESEKLLLQAIAVDPLYYNAYYNLAILYTQQNRLPEAINTLEILQKKYPSQELISIIGDLKSNKQNKTKQTQ